MRRWLPLSLIVIAGVAAIVAAQWQRLAARPSAQGVLSAAADAQHELIRLPAHLQRMSDEDEIALGNELAARYVTHWQGTAGESSSARSTEDYLQALGMRVATGARRKLPWKFHYIADPHFVNAFALPGGHVFVGEGLLALMHSDDTLAGVLGHELEHVDLRHCAERAETEASLRQLGPLGALAGLPVEVFVAGYSKEQEMEADRDGTALAVNAAIRRWESCSCLTNLKSLNGSLRRGRERERRWARPQSCRWIRSRATSRAIPRQRNARRRCAS